MRQDLTEILVILDRSGSMSGVKSTTVESLNKFIMEQRAFPGEANISIYQFDTMFDYIRNSENIKTTKLLDNDEYQPRGGTALYDAMCYGIDEMGKKLASTSENNRASKVMCVVLTDGEENASKAFNKFQVQERVDRQSKSYNWQFIYLGANQDAIMSAQSLGIAAGNAANYMSTDIGTQVAFAAAGGATSAYRTAGKSSANLMVDNQNLTEDLNDIKKI